ncbi:MAG: heavy-metal-associated domain-containing protein [Thiotrichales bacterium]
MLIEIQVENIKCGGCANSIRHGLLEDPRVSTVEVDVAQGLVKLEANDDTLRRDAVARLYKMGYPETGSVEGIAAAAAKAKSFVSCAIGRMSSD